MTPRGGSGNTVGAPRECLPAPPSPVHDPALAMLRNLVMAVALIAVLAGAMYWLIGRDSAPTSVSTEPRDTAGESANAATRAEQIATASQRLMPEGYEAISLRMPLATLRTVRTHAQRDVSVPPGSGREVWEEDDPHGARVIYLVAEGDHTLTQVQFASALHSMDELRAHFEAMQGRYGAATGVWDCPATADSAALRRFTWRRENASVMEAVMVHPNGIALTLVVGDNDAIGAALQRARCQPVRSRDAAANFPYATDIPGEQRPLLREVPRTQ